MARGLFAKPSGVIVLLAVATMAVAARARGPPRPARVPDAPQVDKEAPRTLLSSSALPPFPLPLSFRRESKP